MCAFPDPAIANNRIIGGNIQSDNYSPGVEGWSIDANGNAQFSNVQVIGSSIITVSGAMSLYGNGTGAPLPSSNWTDVTGWTEQFATTGGLTWSGGTITFPVAGLYFLIGSATLNVPPDGSVFATRFITGYGQIYSDQRDQIIGGRYMSANSFTLLSVAGGDTATFQAFQSTGSLQSLTSSQSRQSLICQRVG